MTWRERWQRACEAYRGKKLELEIRLGLRQYGRQPDPMPPLLGRVARRVTSGPVGGVPVKGRGRLTIQAKVLRCRCGDPASHPERVCPQAHEEPEQTVYSGPATVKG